MGGKGARRSAAQTTKAERGEISVCPLLALQQLPPKQQEVTLPRASLQGCWTPADAAGNDPLFTFYAKSRVSHAVSVLRFPPVAGVGETVPHRSREDGPAAGRLAAARGELPIRTPASPRHFGGCGTRSVGRSPRKEVARPQGVSMLNLHGHCQRLLRSHGL